MKRPLAISAITVLAFSTISGIAFAQPDSEACEEAEKVVVSANADLDAGNQQVGAAESELKAAKAAIPDLEAKVQAEIDEDNAEDPPLTEDSAETVAAKAALAAGEKRVATAEATLENEQDDIAGLRAQLDLAIGERDEACAEPDATTTAPPPPVVDNENDIDIDINGDGTPDRQVVIVPDGGVDTGDGSSL